MAILALVVFVSVFTVHKHVHNETKQHGKIDERTKHMSSVFGKK
jgi:hypothetical protein